MSESTSCSERARAALESTRAGSGPSREDLRALGEECPGEFFGTMIESLADSFNPAQNAAYDSLMGAWDLRRAEAPSAVPDRVELVYVLSRVTLGADIKITSMVLDAMKRRFSEARIVFVAGRKSMELFEADQRLDFIESTYPRTGPVSARVAFAHHLRDRFPVANAIVVDPDSRITQLGLISLLEPSRHFHFPSRTAGRSSLQNLSELTAQWLRQTFGNAGQAYIAPRPVLSAFEHPAAALSLGVGDNESKRVPGNFESEIIRLLGERYRTIHVDRGAGGDEARRVTAAVSSSGAADRVRFWEGGFAGFASIIAQSDFYTGYDSAGQHAAAASCVPLITVFKGAPSEIFRARWEPAGSGPRTVLKADGITDDEILAQFADLLPTASF